MALMNCPECGRKNISESKDLCPICGFDIRGFNERAEREQRKDVKIMLLKRIVLSVLAITTVIIIINVVAANQKLKSFKSAVNEFCGVWDDMIEATGLPAEKLCTYCWSGVSGTCDKAEK